MLLSRPNIYEDESVESYILRLAHANGYSVRDFIGIYFNDFHSLDESEIFHPPLKLINLNHSRLKNNKRMSFYESICSAAGQSRFKVINNLVRISPPGFLGLLKYPYKNFEIPAFLFRKDSVPICPSCLTESPYIRQCWHVSIVHCCPKHKAYLLECCPCCQKRISYLDDESIANCVCGYSYAKSGTNPLKERFDQLLTSLADLVSIKTGAFKEGKKCSILPSGDIHTIFGITVFYFKYITRNNVFPDGCSSFEPFLDFLRNWPKSYHDYLKCVAARGLTLLFCPNNKTDFNCIFGSLLCNIQYLPNNKFKENLIMKETYDFFNKRLLSERVHHSRRTISSLLLTKEEVSLMLGVPMDYVAILTSEGILFAKKKTLKAYVGIYTFSEVFNLWKEKFSVTFYS